jgi:hypothetical protein
MTKEEFDNFNFSAYTRVKTKGDWRSITEVDFQRRIITVSPEIYLDLEDIEDIRS